MARLSVVMNIAATAILLGHIYAAAQMYFTAAILPHSIALTLDYLVAAIPDHTTEKAANIPCSSSVHHAI